MLISLLSVFLFYSLPQGTLYSIQGRVVDEQNQPAKGLRVILTDESYFQLQMVYTDVTGCFKFQNQSAGTYSGLQLSVQVFRQKSL